jgi:predicted nuclease with RNAse H fold
VRTLGIDLSADSSRTGACLVDWERGTVEFLGRPASDDELVAAISSVDLAGIDVPLGWPESFVAAVVAHHTATGGRRSTWTRRGTGSRSGSGSPTS